VCTLAIYGGQVANPHTAAEIIVLHTERFLQGEPSNWLAGRPVPRRMLEQRLNGTKPAGVHTWFDAGRCRRWGYPFEGSAPAMVPSSLPPACREQEARHDCGMLGFPKHSDDGVNFARLEVVRLEIFPGRLFHLNVDKRGGETTISIIPRTHEATTGNGNILPRSHLLRFTCVTPKFGRPNSSMSTDECVYARSHVKLLPNMCVSPQETSGHGCRVQAVGRHDERCPDGNSDGTQRTRSNRCCSDAKTPKA
jgi:hypothetical protein